jgi:hypothetical protein
MFPVSFLFSLPEYQLCCVRGMEYMFSYMVQQKMIFPSVDYFSLVPTPHLHHAVFLRVSDQAQKYLYCDLPRGFHIQGVRPIPDTSCPHADHHHLHALFSDLGRHCTPRYPHLATLFDILVQEQGSHSQDSCSFCKHRAQTIQDLIQSLSKPYPFMTLSSIEMFYRFPVRPGTNVEQILKPHVTAIHYLFSQIRNPHLREKLVEGIYEAFQELEEEVEIAVERNDDHQMTVCAQRFKNRVLETIDQCCPFVQVRKIDFKRWLLTLVYFASLQEKRVLDNTASLRLVKKALLLLHLYFHTRVPLPPDTIFYREENQSSHRIHMCVERLNTIHPAFRGEYLQ